MRRGRPHGLGRLGAAAMGTLPMFPQYATEGRFAGEIHPFIGQHGHDPCRRHVGKARLVRHRQQAGAFFCLVKTIEALKARVPIAVIEGDQQTSFDAERIRATGAPAVQINTGKGCHLDAHMVGHALDKLPLAAGGALMIENVGNLVCPAAFDLGEAGKVVILSVTEGENKPLMYPDMFRAARLMLINKIDLLPYVDFDIDKAIAYARRVNPLIEVMRVSAKTGEGFAEWLAWIEKGVSALRG
jgi:hydrogenase nickel incorporation protein HypB